MALIYMEMKRFLGLIMIGFLAQTAFAQEFNLNWIEEDAAMRSRGAKALAMHKSMNTARLPSGMDIKFHRILLQLDPAVRYVTGSVSTYFVPKPDGARTVRFDLHDSLRIDAVKYRGEVITSYTRANNVVTIELPGSIHLTPGPSPALAALTGEGGGALFLQQSDAGDSRGLVGLDSIAIDFQGRPVEDGLGSFAVDEHAGVPVLYTLSEPYGAKDWWPCSQDLNDKIDSIHLVITVPPGNRAAANGMLVAEQHCDDKSIYQWKHKHPIAAYLVGVAVTNYAVYSDYVPLESGDSIEILNYIYPEDSAAFRLQTPGIIRPFQLFNQWFGLYPFADERYGHAQWNWGGGMEHQTMSFMGSFGYDLMAHELAHQWFGDFLTCGSWRDIWLNEGFATYLTGLCYEHDQGGIYWEPFKRLSINRIVREPGGSVYCYDTTNVDRIFDARLSYSKGAIVLHMLRWEMGDEHFFEAVNNYLYDPLLANGYAKTEDLIAHCEVVADTSFQEFFADWVYGEGYPIYQLGYRQRADHELAIELGQSQSDPSVSFFEMTVPVVLYSATNPPDTILLKHTHSGQKFIFNPGRKIDSIAFDPDRWICTANPIILDVTDVPLNQRITLYPNPVYDELTIDLGMPAEGLNIRVMNFAGQVVHTEKTPNGTSLIRIPMRSLPAGVYVVEVEGRGRWKVGR
jgi:hypothetical protein